MKSRCVLVVNERPHESNVIRKILMGENARTTVFVVNSGRRALDVLLGGESDVLQEGVLPDAVLVSDSITDMKPDEIGRIVTKYYRLQHIKFFLLSEMATKKDEGMPTNFSGYFQRPIADDKTTRKKFQNLKMQLDDNTAALSIPLFGFLAQKFSAASGIGFGAAAKAAACIAVVGSVCAVSIAMQPEPAPAKIQSVITDGGITPQLKPKLEIALPAKPAIEQTVVEEQITPLPVETVQPKIDSAITETVPAPVQKQFSIGVREKTRTLE